MSIFSRIGFGCLVAAVLIAGCGKGEEAGKGGASGGPAAGSGGAGGSGMEPLGIKLPQFAYDGTPRGAPPVIAVEPKDTKPVVVEAPKGCVNLALHKKVTGSSDDPIPMHGTLELVTDGDKENNKGGEDYWFQYGAGKSWVQVDLEKSSEIYAVALWHCHRDPRVFYGVVVQLSDDPDFAKGVTTIFNNDQQNVQGLGVGKDLGYVESLNGKVIPAKGVKARYVRAYSKGSNVDDNNDLLELEVWGLPAK